MAKQRIPASKDKVAAKIKKVMKDHPEKTREQAVGMAMGILRHEKKKKR